MFKRHLSEKVKNLFKKFPAIAILGPRQSGKTTLVKNTFPEIPYVNMEKIVDREYALSDPQGFLNQYENGLIIDEIQHTPDLLSYIQVIIDEKDLPSIYILTGSQHLFLNEKIVQTLAGRIAITTLLPLEYSEINEDLNTNEIVYKGFYPRVHKLDINPIDFYPSYIETYVERDVRQIKQITNLNLFQKFLKLCAGRAGQLLNLHSLSNDCGISHTTARSWISLLEASYIVYLLKPHYKNFNKRIIKSPKLYFYDTGILCFLLDISSPSIITTHHMRGALFENLIIMDLLKKRYNHGRRSNLYFWRDQPGHEIDLLIDRDDILIPIEIKSGETITKDYFSALNYFQKLIDVKGYIVYGGNDFQKRKNSEILGWKNFLKKNGYGAKQTSNVN